MPPSITNISLQTLSARTDSDASKAPLSDATPHETFRGRLDVLAVGALSEATLDRWIDAGGLDPRGNHDRPHASSDARKSPVTHTWTRTFARFEPHRSPWATTVHERCTSPNDVAAILVSEMYAGADHPSDALSTAIGPVTIRSFANDPQLPGLRALAADSRLRVVRYRPYRRCTFRSNDGRFVKSLPNWTAAAKLYDDAITLWSASQARALPFRVAQPDCVDSETHSFWQHTVPGSPIVESIRGPEGEDLCRRLGESLGGLASSGVKTTTLITPDVQFERTVRAAAKVARCGAEFADRIGHCLDALRVGHDRYGGGTIAPVHGSPHLHQWLDDRGTLGLVDFDRFAIGPLELDCATFVGELDFEGRVASREALLHALLSGYRSTGWKLNPAVVELYRVHKWIAKAARTAEALRPDGDARLRRVLTRVESSLASSRMR